MDVIEYEARFFEYIKMTDKSEKERFLLDVREMVNKLSDEDRAKIKEKANELADYAISLGHVIE